MLFSPFTILPEKANNLNLFFQKIMKKPGTVREDRERGQSRIPSALE
jgi:hypothetical protein